MHLHYRTWLLTLTYMATDSSMHGYLYYHTWLPTLTYMATLFVRTSSNYFYGLHLFYTHVLELLLQSTITYMATYAIIHGYLQ
jgi:hypothetical protein